jgi:hypothetical protein
MFYYEIQLLNLLAYALIYRAALCHYRLRTVDLSAVVLNHVSGDLNFPAGFFLQLDPARVNTRRIPEGSHCAKAVSGVAIAIAAFICELDRASPDNGTASKTGP